MRLITWFSDQWRSSKRFRVAVAGAALVVLVTIFYPFETTTVPEWNVRIVDDGGNVVRDINVTEHWQNYQLESEGHEEAQTTNQDARVSFAARTIRANLVSRLIGRISRLRGRENRTRPILYGALVVWGSKSYETTVSVYSGEGTPPQEIRVQRLR